MCVYPSPGVEWCHPTSCPLPQQPVSSWSSSCAHNAFSLQRATPTSQTGSHLEEEGFFRPGQHRSTASQGAEGAAGWNHPGDGQENLSVLQEPDSAHGQGTASPATALGSSCTHSRPEALSTSDLFCPQLTGESGTPELGQRDLCHKGTEKEENLRKVTKRSQWGADDEPSGLLKMPDPLWVCSR